MREEVGRSIGLSARKVQVRFGEGIFWTADANLTRFHNQIWFQVTISICFPLISASDPLFQQNQRQKARRPRSQSTTSATRPQQPGPFSTTPHESLTKYSFVSDGRRDELNPDSGSILMENPYVGPHYDDRGYDRPSAAEHPPLTHLYLGSPDSGSQLVGPGMPGSSSARGFSRGFTSLPVQGSASQLQSPPSILQSNLLSFPDYGTSGSRSRPGTAPTARSTDTALQAVSRPRERGHDFSRTLPPLPFDSPSNRTSSSAHGLHRTSILPAPSIATPHSDSPFSHHPPDPPIRTSDLILPRPFTLQPMPQWAPSTFAAVSGSQPQGSLAERSSVQVRDHPILDWAPGRGPLSLATERDSHHRGPVEPRRKSPTSNLDQEATPRLELTTPPRSRFDPVRSAFVPYSTPPGQSQQRPG
jgi:hypothetical protein